MNKLFSIIIPYYNDISHVKRCLDSVINQKFFDYEIILVNDGSSDDLQTILETYNVDIKLVTIVHGGVSRARNEGIKQSTGRYLMFLDSDDYLLPNSLNRLSKIINDNDYDIVKYNFARLISGETNPSILPFVGSGLFNSDNIKNFIYRMIKTNNVYQFSVNTNIYKRDLIKDIKFNENYYIYDGLSFTVKAYLNANTVFSINDVLYLYEIHNKGLSSRYNQRYKYTLAVYLDLKEYLSLLNKWEEYKDILKNYLFVVELVSNGTENGALFQEYSSNISRQEMIKNISEFVNSQALYEAICDIEYQEDNNNLMVLKLLKNKDGNGIIGFFDSLMDKYEKFLINKYGLLYPREYYVSKEKKLVYMSIGKVACSSIIASFTDYKYEDDYSVHTYMRTKELKTTYELNNEEKEYYKFTFVRNPFTRLVSAYESKYHTDLELGFNEMNTYLKGYMAIDEGFDEFIRKVCSIDDKKLNFHFNSQYLLTHDEHGNCLFDYIGKFENLKEDFNYIKERFGLYELPKLNVTKKPVSKNWKDYYTLETAQMVYEKFNMDFKTFDYKDSYTSLMEYLK